MFKGGKPIQEPVSLGDIYPTIAQLVNQKPTHPLAGKSLIPLVKGGKREFTACYSVRNSKAVMTKQYHLIVHDDGSTELYNRVNDPWALKNLSSSLPEVVERLRKKEW